MASPDGDSGFLKFRVESIIKLAGPGMLLMRLAADPGAHLHPGPGATRATFGWSQMDSAVGRAYETGRLAAGDSLEIESLHMSVASAAPGLVGDWYEGGAPLMDICAETLRIRSRKSCPLNGACLPPIRPQLHKCHR